MAINSVSYNAGRAVAPALCVVVLPFIGFAGAFALNALSFLVFAIMLRAAQPQRSRCADSPVRASDGIRIVLADSRLWLLLCMIATVTLADDPVLVLGPARALQLGVSHNWPGYFLTALGCGTILGSLTPLRTRRGESTSRVSRRAAASLLVLGVSIVGFTYAPDALVALCATAVAGMAALGTGSAAQALLVRRYPGQEGSILAIWAIAWAGTKPVASLADGWLANRYGVQGAAVLLALPAMGLALSEMLLPHWFKNTIKEWGHKLTAAASPRLSATGHTASPATTDSRPAPAASGFGPWQMPATIDDMADGATNGPSGPWDPAVEPGMSIT